MVLVLYVLLLFALTVFFLPWSASLNGDRKNSGTIGYALIWENPSVVKFCQKKLNITSMTSYQLKQAIRNTGAYIDVTRLIIEIFSLTIICGVLLGLLGTDNKIKLKS